MNRIPKRFPKPAKRSYPTQIRSVSRADLEKWESRYAGRDARGPGPVDPFLLEIEAELPTSGAALDLAGGNGRHALFLAERGFDVTLVDVSPRGLALAEAAADASGLSISTAALDLDEGPLPEGPFELILCSWYMISHSLWDEVARVLAPAGRLAYVQPTSTHLERHKHPGRSFVIEVSELEAQLSRVGLEVLRLDAGWDANGNHTARLWARKTGLQG